MESKSQEHKYEEIKISAPWGHLSGKWYGSQLQKPIVALHGWQDNAGTFDTLIPLLPSNVSVFAVELPGHGFSSPLPHGMHYHASDFLFIIQIVMNAYKWKTIALMGHSLGAMVIFQFSALFPEKVDFAILLEYIGHEIYSTKVEIDIKRYEIEKFIELDERNRSEKEPPSYTYEECVQKLCEGTFLSVSEETAKYLLNRNLKKSKIHPNKYYFRRDGRLKMREGRFKLTHAVYEGMAQLIKSPLIMIKAHGNSSHLFENNTLNINSVFDIMKKKNPNFIYESVSGTHHVHLTEPEKVAKLINPFIEKFYIKNNIVYKNKL